MKDSSQWKHFQTKQLSVCKCGNLNMIEICVGNFFTLRWNSNDWILPVKFHSATLNLTSLWGWNEVQNKNKLDGTHLLSGLNWINLLKFKKNINNRQKRRRRQRNANRNITIHQDQPPWNSHNHLNIMATGPQTKWMVIRHLVKWLLWLKRLEYRARYDVIAWHYNLRC